jgi:signal transduction histidine kinase
LEAVTNLLFLSRNSSRLPDVHEYLDQADRELRRVSIIANQTLRFRKQNTEPQPIHCSELYAGVLSILEGKIKNAGVIVERRDRARRPAAVFEGDIRQVLSNLIGNAIDATSRAGRLMLRCREAKSWRTGEEGILLTVAETGCGMPPGVLAKVFEPFYTTKGTVGTGLGLCVSKDIVDRHHGQLKIRSSQQAGHTGTVVQLFLPFDGKPKLRIIA